jgi:AmiR/NasT family two-component response regulator
VEATQVVELIIALFGGGALMKALTVVSDRKKINADAAAVISGAAVAMLQPLQDQLNSATSEAIALRTEVSKLRGQVETMSRKLAEHGIPY